MPGNVLPTPARVGKSEPAIASAFKAVLLGG